MKEPFNTEHFLCHAMINSNYDSTWAHNKLKHGLIVCMHDKIEALKKGTLCVMDTFHLFFKRHLKKEARLINHTCEAGHRHKKFSQIQQPFWNLLPS